MIDAISVNFSSIVNIMDENLEEYSGLFDKKLEKYTSKIEE